MDRLHQLAFAALLWAFRLLNVSGNGYGPIERIQCISIALQNMTCNPIPAPPPGIHVELRWTLAPNLGWFMCSLPTDQGGCQWAIGEGIDPYKMELTYHIAFLINGIPFHRFFTVNKQSLNVLLPGKIRNFTMSEYDFEKSTGEEVTTQMLQWQHPEGFDADKMYIKYEVILQNQTHNVVKDFTYRTHYIIKYEPRSQLRQAQVRAVHFIPDRMWGEPYIVSLNLR